MTCRSCGRDFPEDLCPDCEEELEEIRHDDDACPMCGGDSGGEICPPCQDELDEIVEDAKENPIPVQIIGDGLPWPE